MRGGSASLKRSYAGAGDLIDAPRTATWTSCAEELAQCRRRGRKRMTFGGSGSGCSKSGQSGWRSSWSWSSRTSHKGRQRTAWAING